MKQQKINSALLLRKLLVQNVPASQNFSKLCRTNIGLVRNICFAVRSKLLRVWSNFESWFALTGVSYFSMQFYCRQHPIYFCVSAWKNSSCMQDCELFIITAHMQQSTIGPSDWNGTMTYANTAILRMLWLALFKLKLEPPFQVAYDKNVVWFILHIRMLCCFYLEFILMQNQICRVSQPMLPLWKVASLFMAWRVNFNLVWKCN